jgi:hypothetical protein
MATVNKDFKIKSGLIVEGATATVGGFSVLTKKQDDQDYIVGLIGGTATSANEANKVVKRDASGNFAAGTITATVTGTVSSLSNHDTADLAENASNKYFTNQRALDATAAAYDAAGSASAAQAAAQTFATNADSAVRTAVTTEIGTAKTEAINAAAADATSKANAARSAAEATAAAALSTAISTEVTNRNSAITTAVAAVVDSAPAALDTLNELAAALADSPDTVSNLTTLVGTKAPLASPALTGVPTAPTAAADTSTTQIATTAFAKAEADAAQAAAEATASADATSKANAAQSAAATDATNKANAAQAAAIAVANALTTSDVEEGTAQYFTDARAKSSAADLLVGATKTNITITGTGAGLVITAENGVADSTTSDLAEGTNKYFTDARARTAVDGTDRSFTSVAINSVAKQVAATLSAPTAGVQTAHAFAKADYRSAEYLVKVANGNHTEISKVLLTLDSTDGIAITEYGIVGTNGSLATVSAGISGANVQLLVTTANNTSTVTVVGTLLA